MDPISLALFGGQLALPYLARLFGGGGDDEVSADIPPELRGLLAQAMLAQSRQQSLVDPAAGNIFGMQSPDAVPLRPAVNQLAFALLPNFVRPENSLFPGTAPATQPLIPGQNVSPLFFGVDPAERAQRESLIDEFSEDISSGRIEVDPLTGRLQLTGFTDRRGEGPIVLDDIKHRLTPHKHREGENASDKRFAIPRK